MTQIDVPAWIAIIVGVLTLASLITGALAVVRSSWIKSQTAILLSTNEGLDQRVKFLEDEAKRKDEEVKEKEHAFQVEKAADKAHNDELMKRVEVLQSVVTGKKELQNILDFLVIHDGRVDGFMLGQERHDADAADRHKVIRGLLAANKTHIQKVEDKVDQIAQAQGVEFK